MPDQQSQYHLWVYQDIDTIKDGMLSLVKNKQTGQLAVKKRVRNDVLHIYEQLSKLQHKNLPRVYEIIHEADELIVIHEYIQGESLQSMLDNGRAFTETEAIGYAIQLCDALDVLHAQTPPIIHRDMKPSNVLLSADGVIKLIDFDAAREYKTDAFDDTVHMGTHGYAAPEQYGFGQTDARTDIYAIGILLQKLLGDKDGLKSVLRRKTKGIIEKCLALNPKQRYSTVGKLKAALNAKYGKKRIWLIAGVFCLASIAAIAVYSLRKSNTPGNDEDMISTTPPAYEASIETSLSTAPINTNTPYDAALLQEWFAGYTNGVMETLMVEEWRRDEQPGITALGGFLLRDSKEWQAFEMREESWNGQMGDTPLINDFTIVDFSVEQQENSDYILVWTLSELKAFYGSSGADLTVTSEDCYLLEIKETIQFNSENTTKKIGYVCIDSNIVNLLEVIDAHGQLQIPASENNYIPMENAHSRLLSR